MKVLVVRPKPGADATAARIEASGREAVVLPLFEVQPVAWNVPQSDQYDALLVTSANAVRHAGAGLSQFGSLPIYAVGSTTSYALKKAGLNVAFSGDAGIEALLQVIKAAGYGRLIWLAGEDHMDIKAHLDISVDPRIVYRSAALPAPENFSAIVKSADVVLLHSSRAALHFAGLCDGLGIDRACVTLSALSPAIACSAGAGWQKIGIAATPDDAALLLRL